MKCEAKMMKDVLKRMQEIGTKKHDLVYATERSLSRIDPEHMAFCICDCQNSGAFAFMAQDVLNVLPKQGDVELDLEFGKLVLTGDGLRCAIPRADDDAGAASEPKFPIATTRCVIRDGMKELRESVACCAKVSDHLAVRMGEDGLHVEAEGYQRVIRAEGAGEGRAQYPCAYVKNILRSEWTEMMWDKDYPVRFEYGCVRTYLAPRIENKEG